MLGLIESSRITIPKCYIARVWGVIILFEVITSFKVVSKYFEPLVRQRLQRIKKLSGSSPKIWNPYSPTITDTKSSFKVDSKSLTSLHSSVLLSKKVSKIEDDRE